MLCSFINNCQIKSSLVLSSQSEYFFKISTIRFNMQSKFSKLNTDNLGICLGIS